jgi:preprotein translocase subunit SecA
MNLIRFLFGAGRGTDEIAEIAEIRRRRAAMADLDNEALRQRFRQTEDMLEAIAAVCEAASRTLSLEMFDVQLRGALAMARDRIAEMQTGEGKTLACTPAVAWLARSGAGVHAMTVNDYLARRDARWMGPIYGLLGLTVGCIQQTMGPEERRAAYRCDITYATANEVGFDFLRDQIALTPDEQVHRPFAAAVIDEADSILIDEARIPLVLAGGEADDEVLARQVEPIVRHFERGVHYTLDEYGRNIALAPAGARWIERAARCRNIFAESSLPLYTAVHNAIHAHALLRRNVDYVVKNGAIESVDEFKGRIAQDRRWPAGLHAAIEAKERVPISRQGRVLGSITLQNLSALYPRICGMTGTAATQREEFRKCYGIEVEVIPTNRPVIRADAPDVVFPTKAAKEKAVAEEIRGVHESGQPVLVGTASVEESERLGRLLGAIPHSVLNARNEEAEAEIVARAGERGAVTISTNMAGRGVDIRLGDGVAALGGLYVIGTNRHESRRIDHQLRGRAGRQGDPGRSRFFISLEDDLLVRFGIADRRLGYDAEGIQRLVESQNLEIRTFLAKYEGVVEGERQHIQEQRQAILVSEEPELERTVALTTIDDLWSEFLAAVAELRSGVQWYSWGGRDPLHEYLTRIDAMCRELDERIPVETAERLEKAQSGGGAPPQRGATWTYLTTDRPFGDLTERFMKGVMRTLRGRR